MLKLTSALLKMLQSPTNKLIYEILIIYELYLLIYSAIFLGQLMEQQHFLHFKVAVFTRSCVLHPKTSFIDSKRS